MGLCEQAIAEPDPEGLIELTKEIESLTGRERTAT